MIVPLKSTEQILEVTPDRLKEIATAIHKEGCAVFYDQKFNESQIIEMQK